GHQGDGRFAQKTQAAPPGRFLQHSDRLAIDNDLAQFIVKKQDFGDGGTPGVSGAAAAPAALAGDKVEVAYFGWIQSGFGQFLGAGLDPGRATRARQAQQPLGQNAVQRRHEAVGIDVHLGKAPDDVENVVRMDRGKDQVAGKGGLDCDLGGLRIADFPNHDLVRVVAQDRAQAAGEGEALFLVYRDLQHARQLVFHRILDRDDLVLALVDLGDHRVQGGGLAASGGACHQNHPVRFARQPAQGTNGAILEAERSQADALDAVAQVLLVKDTQHRILAQDAGHDRHAEVDLPA